MLLIKSITLKNFLSVGNVTQAIGLADKGLVLVLGQNIDLGSSGSRNGVGKSTIIQALCYGLYGTPLTNIKKDNLINKTNEKNMFVTVEFEKDGTNYKIERGRRPNTIRFLVNGKQLNTDEEGDDETHGDMRVTQLEINGVLGLSRELFKHIFALNTITDPFLSLGAHPQRQIIEELLGVTQLSEKGEKLKEINRFTKEAIIAEEFRIKSIQEANNTIQSNIDTLKKRSGAWKIKNSKELKDLSSALNELLHLDIDQEISAHKSLQEIITLETKLKTINNDIRSETLHLTRVNQQIEGYQKQIANYENNVKNTQEQLKLAEEHGCPTCGQEIHDEKHEEIITDLKNTLHNLTLSIDENINNINEYEKSTQEIINLIKGYQENLNSTENLIKEIGKKPTTFYSELQEAYNHKNTLESLQKEQDRVSSDTNPFEEQIEQLTKNGLQDVSYDEINSLTTRQEHQDFLIKLLLNKDSFVRKKIIEQNLAYLNHRLNSYLDKLGLPHEVIFRNDLSVEITELGRDFDFDNLSRGERNRLILGLSFSFRDVWESLNMSCNLMFIDELIDSGMDPVGVENSLSVLKNMGRDQGKDVFLISHKEELLSRVSRVMLVKKEGGFTSFIEDVEDIEDLEETEEVNEN